jgi:hypothetical protein
MMNADKPNLWKADIQASVDFYNAWFLQFAPQTYRTKRIGVTAAVEQAIRQSSDLTTVTAAVIQAHPGTVPVLRMCCCPPIARERLAGLAGVPIPLVLTLEAGKLPARLNPTTLQSHLDKVADIIQQLLDVDLFPWLSAGRAATKPERNRAASVVADRLCGAMSDPIIRNAQEERQLQTFRQYLAAKGYTQQQPAAKSPLTGMAPGTFAVRLSLLAGGARKIKVPIDVVVQPKRPRASKLPVLFELKSAGDFTNVNKRRKEEAKKMSQLKSEFGNDVEYILFLCGYFNAGYLGYEAAEGMDWVWEHRIKNLDQLGL